MHGELIVVNRPPNGTQPYVAAYAPPYAGPPTIIPFSANLAGPWALAADKYDDIFVSDVNYNKIYEYAPPYAATVATISAGLATPYSIGIDPNTQTLFAANWGANTVSRYTVPYGQNYTAVSSRGSGPIGLALNSRGDLFISNESTGSGTLVYYASPWASAPTVIGDGNTNNVFPAIAAAPNGYVAVSYDGTLVDVYAPPYNGVTQTVACPNGCGPVAFDSASDLFICGYNLAGAYLSEYAFPYNSAPMATTASLALTSFSSIAIDLSNDVFISSGVNAVYEFRPPYAGAPSQTITSGLNQPAQLLVTP